MNGWIKINRRIVDWEWFDNPLMVKAWIWMLINARSDDGRWQGVDVKRGQIITSFSSLAKNLGASEKQIRGILERLKRTGEVALKSSNRYTIITISKYDTYQITEIDDIGKEGQAEGQTEGEQRANKGHADGQQCKNKEIKKDNISKDISSKESSSPYGEVHFRSDLEALGVTHQTAIDWIACRKGKRMPFTVTALTKTKRELEKIPDKTPEELIRYAAERGWGGFEARYFIESISRTQQYGPNQRYTPSGKDILGDGNYESTI